MGDRTRWKLYPDGRWWIVKDQHGAVVATGATIRDVVKLAHAEADKRNESIIVEDGTGKL